MKKYSIITLTIIVITIFSACASEGALGNVSATDFTSADFSGKWCVSEVRFPGGKPLTSGELQQIGAGITLELLEGGVYFVYGPDGAVFGQGQYSVSGSDIICTAGLEQTVYQIIDANTLRSVSEDRSVTIMSRQPEPSPSVSEGEQSDEDIIDSDTDQEIPSDSDMPHENTSETSAGVSAEVPLN